jgi:hypothetical protein
MPAGADLPGSGPLAGHGGASGTGETGAGHRGRRTAWVASRVAYAAVTAWATIVVLVVRAVWQDWENL